MIDPNMNAAKKGYYYFVNGREGPWYGSWKGLDKKLIILNWNHFANEKRKKSLRFFEKLGHKQILCGHYDLPVFSVGNRVDGGDCSPRPPTPPYTRVRIRRFTRSAWGGVCAPPRLGPSVPRTLDAPRRYTRRCRRRYSRQVRASQPGCLRLRRAASVRYRLAPRVRPFVPMHRDYYGLG